MIEKVERFSEIIRTCKNLQDKKIKVIVYINIFKNMYKDIY